MADPTDAEQKIARLEAELAALRTQVQGSGAIAQDHSVAAGQGGQAAARDIYNVWNPPPADADEEDLRCAYLHRLVYLTRPLALAGVDPALASGDRDARLSLDAVYTALLTLSPAEEQITGRAYDLPTDFSRRSALAQLNRHPRLVRVQLRKILEADSSLAAEIAKLLEGAGPKTTYQAEVHGSGAIAQGGSFAAGAGGIAAGRDVRKGD